MKISGFYNLKSLVLSQRSFPESFIKIRSVELELLNFLRDGHGMGRDGTGHIVIIQLDQAFSQEPSRLDLQNPILILLGVSISHSEMSSICKVCLAIQLCQINEFKLMYLAKLDKKNNSDDHADFAYGSHLARHVSDRCRGFKRTKIFKGKNIRYKQFMYIIRIKSKLHEKLLLIL